jgi:hypothetical protein
LLISGFAIFLPIAEAVVPHVVIGGSLLSLGEEIQQFPHLADFLQPTRAGEVVKILAVGALFIAALIVRGALTGRVLAFDAAERRCRA